MFVPKFASFAQSDPIDDGGVVEFIWQDCILGSEEDLKQSCVGIEAGGIQNGIFSAVE